MVPERGVQYPRGLEPGDTVAVEYDLSDPEQVRVAGRSAVDGIVPTLLGLAAVDGAGPAGAVAAQTPDTQAAQPGTAP